MTSSSSKSSDKSQTTSIPSPEEVATEGVRETVESIVVALILAFVFRAFVVEAFVIPTGSMAPSLYGLHANLRCDNCQYTFAYGLKEQMMQAYQSRGGLHEKFSVRCPNCTWQDGDNATITSIIPNAGDRILVLKWPYDIGGDLLGPQRWDVVVFKNPQDGEMNYIKRLLGLPGEVLEIIDGDVYVAKADDLSEALRDKLAVPQPLRNQNWTQQDQNELDRHLRIQRKTDLAQQSLWMLHYDHDFLPAKTEGEYGSRSKFDPPRWYSEDGSDAWDADRPIIRFSAADAEGYKWLRLGGRRIEDEYGYNNTSTDQAMERDPRYGRPARFAVTDFKLAFTLMPEASGGALCVRFNKHDDNFKLDIDLNGDVVLYRLDDTGLPATTEAIPRKLAAGKLPRPLMDGTSACFEVESLDYRISLRVDGKDVLATDEDTFAPNIKALRKHRPSDLASTRSTYLRIGARGAPMELAHVKVMRDVFYRHSQLPYASREQSAWGTQGNPIYLRDRDNPEYYCCGDNSPQSQDSRLWTEASPFLTKRAEYQLGTVPADQMIGRAFFVYWPSGLRFSDHTLAIIPNVGRMRFIR